MALAKGPVIDAEDAGGRSLHNGGTPHHAQECGRASRHPEPAHEPSPRLATQRERQQTEDRLEPRRPPSVRVYDVRQLFGEDPPGAGWLTAEELADMEVETNRVATPWQISDRPLVMAMDPRGPRAATGTRSSRSGGLQGGDDLVRADRHISKLETVTGRQKVGGEGASTGHRCKSYRPSA
jgi:hypothetical protein